jgi:hypothetical protein
MCDCGYDVISTVILTFIGLTVGAICSSINYPAVVYPVCVTDGVTIKTFSNPCWIHIYNCMNPAKCKLSKAEKFSRFTCGQTDMTKLTGAFLQLRCKSA